MSSFSNSNNLDLDNESDIQELERTAVRIDGEQTITGKKTFNDVIINDLSVNEITTFSTQDGIIEQLSGNTTADLLDYGNYATYNAGGVKFKGVINKAGTDKFYVFHNQINEPSTSLNLNTQALGTLIVREPTQNNEVATKQYVDNNSGGGGGGGGNNNLPPSGGTMTGDINMGDNSIIGIEELSLTGTDFQVYNDFNSSTGQGGTWVRTDNRLIFGKHLPVGNEFLTCEMNMNTQQTIFSGELSLSNKKITSLATPTMNSDAANKGYVDSVATGGGLPVSGGTMNGTINMGSNKIINLGQPTDDSDAVTKIFLQNQIDSIPYLPVSGGSLTGNLIMNNASRIFFDNTNSVSMFSSSGNIFISRGTGENKFVSISPTEMEMRNLNINMGSNKISGLIGGSAGTDAVNVNQMNTRLSLFGGTMNADINMGTNTLTNLKEPFNQLDAATKKYVDEQVAAAIQGPINNELTQKSDKTLTDLELERLDGLIQSLL